MALNWDALTTVAAMRSYIARERSGSSADLLADAKMEQVINQVSASIGFYTGRQLIATATALVYILDGDGSDLIELPEYPIVSITEIKNLASAEIIPARTSYTGTGYSSSDADTLAGVVRLTGYATDAGSALLKVTARLGYDATTAAPVAPAVATGVTRAHAQALAQLEQAALCWGSLIFVSPTPSIDTVTVEGGASFTTREQDVPTRVRGLLRPFMRYML